MSQTSFTHRFPAKRPALRLRRRKRQDGSSLVEFAFILILLMSILLGIMGFGHALYAYHFVSHAAKTATRWAAVNGYTCGPTTIAGTPFDSSCNGTNGMNYGPASPTDIQNYVLTLVPSGIDATKVGTTATWPVQLSSSVDPSPPICSQDPTVTGVAGSPFPNYPGCTVEVKVGYAFNFIFPLLPTVSTTTAPCTQPGICLSSTSDMIIAH